MRVNYQGNVGWSTPTVLPDMVDSYELLSIGMPDVSMQVLLVCIVRKKWVYYSNILKIPVVWILGSNFLKF